ncbi:uncharacterized protein F5Z01DRAFT_495976 [Emericellopsis atlantica]|uniref:Protein kinase domain-containing protein n=1 Tax=Emericellopsis atlantica TaxID=2614577 RepID=A0A9P7ZCJ6_9HYPO|nr:uncharacterized protein F5Z01DRAFT_495976 [Emericellopsis atlantica]KAG9249475.1 hypothetical protein F5Z01DRAFT_495976 [Emericellopsis atlantica]
MADHSSPDYRELYLNAEEGRKQAEEREKHEAERRRRAEERNRQTSFTELLHRCHDLLSRQLRVETPSRSTSGKIPIPTGKYCPTRLEHWVDCPEQLLSVYSSVCQYLQSDSGHALRLFSSLPELEGLSRRFARKPLSSEQDLEAYERFGVEEHVHDIIAELCKLPAARDEFRLGDGIQFSNHANALSRSEACEADTSQPSSIPHPRPDQFCIHRVNGNPDTLLTTVEYKPPHKLPVATLRVGLRPMDLWKKMVRSNKIPTDQDAKVQYNAERLVCSAIVQEYHVMVQEGIEYSYLTNGIARVFLRIPQDEPSTLYYFLCDPHSELDTAADPFSQLSKTSVARVLCLCLMAFRSPARDQEWRNRARLDLHTWKTSFEHTRSQIPNDELQQIPHSDSTGPEFPSPESGSSYAPPPSSPLPSPTEGRKVSTRSKTSCARSEIRQRSRSPNSSGSDANQTAGQKRRISRVASSPSGRQTSRQQESGHDQGDQSRRRALHFCTQRCLLGLQTGGCLDELCPNVEQHRGGREDRNRHLISTEDLVLSLKSQLDEVIDRCIPLGGCGDYGAPFKLTCTTYGYTVVGKGTTSGFWNEVSREVQAYQILRKAQGSAVPVFLGTMDLAKIYFLHGAGPIRHMLVMGWGGESTATMQMTPQLRREMHRSIKEIRALGIRHGDLKRDNVLWSEELKRALVIDFHRSTLISRFTKKRPRVPKRGLTQLETENTKRLRVSSEEPLHSVC